MNMLSTKILETLPRSMRILRKLSTAGFKGAITIHHLRIMVMVAEGLSQAQMAETLQVSPAAVSKMIDGLMRKKLLSKTVGLDKRSWKVKLTASGKKILSQSQTEVKHKIDEFVKCLTKTEQKELSLGLKALDKLMLNISHE